MYILTPIDLFLVEVVDGKQVSITALTSSQGLIWVGSSTGHILTIPVPVNLKFFP